VPNLIAIFRRRRPNGGVECRWGRHKLRFSTIIWLSIDDWWSANNNCDLTPSSLQQRPPLISESLFVTTSINDHVKEKRREQNLFAHGGKSEAEVTNSRRLRSTYCTTERHEASQGLSATAGMLVQLGQSAYL